MFHDLNRVRAVRGNRDAAEAGEDYSCVRSVLMVAIGGKGESANSHRIADAMTSAERSMSELTPRNM
jgi:hypothetical protein